MMLPYIKKIFILIAAVAAFSAFFAAPAKACTTCGCIAAQHGDPSSCPTTRGHVDREHKSTRLHITEEFDDWNKFLKDIMWGQYLHPAFMRMTEQMTATAMQQTLMIGAVLDAKHQLETDRSFSARTAEAHRDYHPDMGMCVFGTGVRSLAAAERNAEFTAFTLGQRSIDRQVGSMLSSGAGGADMDMPTRYELFLKRYCNKSDNNAVLKPLCTGTKPELINRDIDFSRTVDHAATLDIDFSDKADASDDETDVIALASNLYSHSLMTRMPETVMKDRDNQDELLDMRSAIAKRSVAEHSFNTIVGMKAMSSPERGKETGKYLKVILKQLGVTNDEDIKKMLGERPSYDAMMQVLTQKVYQNPSFYVDLYETVANTERKKAAMQAVGLMQDFDTWQSYLRTEAMLSVILELELVKAQTEVQNTLNRLR